jgi:hypothetical protein
VTLALTESYHRRTVEKLFLQYLLLVCFAHVRTIYLLG